MLQALEDEFRERTPYKLDIAEVIADGETFTIRVTPVSARKLRDDQDGWTAAGSKRLNEPYPWIGEVTAIDPDHATLVLSKVNGERTPLDSQAMFLYEPDYQSVIRDWAQAMLSNGAAIPEHYQRLVRGELENCPDLLDLHPYLNQDQYLRAAQKLAAAATSRTMVAVWGPPGTGKTFTLGSAAACLSLAGKKVLVLAPTNSATDQAVLAIDNARERIGQQLADGELIRPGRPVLSEVEERTHLLAWTQALSDFSSRIQSYRLEINRLEKDRLRLDGAERTAVNQKVGKLNEQLKGLETARASTLWKLAEDARIIVTTLTSALHRGEILQAMAQEESAFILDEASMVPRYVLTRILAEPVAHFSLFGDLRQLGPIRRNSNPNDNNSIHWIAHSAFDAISASNDNDIERLQSSGCLKMLTEQNRMHDGLCQPVSRLFYLNKLRTVDSPPEPPLLPGWPSSGCVIVDPWQTPLPSFAGNNIDDGVDYTNHRCERSAWIALRIAWEALNHQADRSVLMMSPFRGQADLLRKLVNAHLSQYRRIKAGTIHVSQGQEADLVILDPIRPTHKWLMGTWGDSDIKRLFCVAFSRSRIQMILLGRPQDIRTNPYFAILAENAATWTPPALPEV